MSANPEQQDPRQKRDDYQAPALVVLGTLGEMTAGVANVGADIVFSTGVPSDRRLKRALHPVAPGALLATLDGLKLSCR